MLGMDVRWFFVFLLAASSTTGTWGSTGMSNPVPVLRCCSEGEALTRNSTCVPDSDNQMWLPNVFQATASKIINMSNNHADILREVTDNSPGIVWRIHSNTRPFCQKGFKPIFIPNHGASPIVVVLENGQLWIAESVDPVEAGQFCLDARGALVCLPRDDHPSSLSHIESDGPSRPRPRVRECCGPGGHYSEARGGCATSEPRANSLGGSGALLPGNVTLIAGFPNCLDYGTGNYVIVARLDGKQAILESDGSVLITNGKFILQPDSYCLEHILEDPQGRDAAVFTCAALVPTRAPVASDHDDVRFTLYPIGLFISVFFLAATLCSGCLLPNTQYHAIHWRCQTCHVACLLNGDLLLAIVQFSGPNIDPAACVIFAILMHFFFLSAFFWLNTMCFNIWWTFRDIRPSSLDKSQEAFRLRGYGLYAWGGPFLITAIAALLDNLPNSDMTAIRPRFGEIRCWFYGDMEILTFFIGPVGVLLLINLCLFLATARELTCGLWKREVVKATTERATLGRICLKLLVVMGLTWLADVLSWAIGGPNYMWYLSDIINALQGVFIFIVVGCQPQVWSAINRLWCLRTPRRSGCNGNATSQLDHLQQLSSCSQGLPSLNDSMGSPINTSSTNTTSSCKLMVPLETI